MVSKIELVPKNKLWCQPKTSSCIQNTTALGVEASFFGSAAASGTLTGKLISCRWLFLGFQQKPLVDSQWLHLKIPKKSGIYLCMTLPICFRASHSPNSKAECTRQRRMWTRCHKHRPPVETPKLREVLTWLSPKENVSPFSLVFLQPDNHIASPIKDTMKSSFSSVLS